MKGEIIAVGDELLTGQTIDTNSAWIAAEMNRIGIEITGISAIPDMADRITGALEKATRRSQLILITGGLGPTSDDITKQTLCAFFDTRLVSDSEVLENIRRLLGRRGVSVNENNLAQSYVPENCTVLMNGVGTAPGMWFEKEGSVIVSMPGVPYEMKYIISEHVIPRLYKRGLMPEIAHSHIMTYGMPEAQLAEKLSGFESGLPEGVKLAYLPSSGVIKLRLTARGGNSAGELLKLQVDKLREIIPDLIFAEYESSLEETIGKELSVRNMTLSVAESCTGGNIARLITSVPGSSVYFPGGVVAYSNEIKTSVLGVGKDTLARHGAVSRECACEMAVGIRRLTGSSVGVATTGIAGPGGGSPEKPVGTVCIAVSTDSGTVSDQFIFGTDRNINIRRFSLAAIDMVRRQIIRL